jgi:hypothetical protein
MSTLVRSAITLINSLDVPEVLTVVGQANWKGYDLYLWDSETHNVRIGGNVGSEGTDRFSLQKSPAELVNCRLVWEGKVRPFGPWEKQLFSVKCVFFQGETPVPLSDPEPAASGTFTSGEELVVIICTFKLPQ